jgi:hypothetical protein
VHTPSFDPTRSRSPPRACWGIGARPEKRESQSSKQPPSWRWRPFIWCPARHRRRISFVRSGGALRASPSPLVVLVQRRPGPAAPGPTGAASPLGHRALRSDFLLTYVLSGATRRTSVVLSTAVYSGPLPRSGIAAPRRDTTRWAVACGDDDNDYGVSAVAWVSGPLRLTKDLKLRRQGGATGRLRYETPRYPSTRGPEQ